MTGRNIPPSAFAGDTGESDAALDAALAAFASEPTPARSVPVFAALRDCRLVVAVEAVLVEADASGADKESAMALATLVGRDGRQAIPAFSSTHTLARWRPDARPVPVHGEQVLRWTVDQGYAALVLDPAGPVPFAVEGQDLADLAAGFVPVPGQASLGLTTEGSLRLRPPADGSAELLDRLRAVLRDQQGIEAAWGVEITESQDESDWRLAVAVQVAPGGSGRLDELGRTLLDAAAEPLVLIPVSGELAGTVAGAGIQLLPG